MIKVGSVVRLITPSNSYRDMIDCLGIVETVRESYDIPNTQLYELRCFDHRICDFHIILTVYSYRVSEVS